MQLRYNKRVDKNILQLKRITIKKAQHRIQFRESILQLNIL